MSGFRAVMLALYTVAVYVGGVYAARATSPAGIAFVTFFACAAVCLAWMIVAKDE